MEVTFSEIANLGNNTQNIFRFSLIQLIRNVLDISNGDVVSKDCHNLMSQHWFINHDGTIQNSMGNLVLDIYQNKLRLGNKIIVFSKHGGENQHFIVQPVT